MKNLIAFCFILLMSTSVWAQAPEKLSYQAVIRNASDELVANVTIGMQISILQGSADGTAVYVETQTPSTNANGLVSIEIGDGTLVSGNFSSIDWANGSYFIKTETDPSGGTNYSIIGTSQMLSTPYALHAKTAKTVTGGITETDPVYSASVASGITATDISNWNNKLDAYTETDPSVPTGTQAGQMQYWNGSAWVLVAAGKVGQVLTFSNGSPKWKTVVGPTDVLNPTTGAIWMDRNLGASRVATSSTDADAYGDLYQWGRAADGHEKRNSGTTSTLATSDTPGHSNFILNDSEPYDWGYGYSTDFWEGVNGTNNPCPSGYRLPTETEWNAERQSWSGGGAAGAFASPLKLPLAGFRNSYDGNIESTGNSGSYWSSTSYYTQYESLAASLYISNSASIIEYDLRAYGMSVRCIKD